MTSECHECEAIKREVWEEIRRVVEDIHEPEHCNCGSCIYDRLKTLIDSKLK
jgi:hypothetical protein